MFTIERRVRGEIGRRCVRLGEEDEPRVFHAVRFGGHYRPEHAFGDVDVGVEVDAVTARGDRPVMTGNRVRVVTRVVLRDQDFQSCLKFFEGEHQGQFVKHVRRTLAVLTHRLQTCVEEVAVEYAIARRTDHWIRLARVERDFPVGTDESAAKTNTRTMTLAHTAKTHHEAPGSFGNARLVGVRHDAGITDCGRLERVLVRERGAEEEPTLLAQVFLRVQPVAHAFGVLTEYGLNVSVPTRESLDDFLQSSAYVGFG